MGFVGLGRVSGSQKTTPLDDLLGLARAVVPPSTSLPTASMELCDTPVECDLEMRAEAVGVAVCKTGRPMTSFEGTKGNVEDLGRDGGFFSSEGDVPPQGRVLVFDNKGIVCDVVGGNVVVIGGGNDVGVAVEVGLLLLLTFSCFPAEPSIGLGVSPANLSSFLVGLSV